MVNFEHPFKRGVRDVISDHFADKLAARFELEFETNMYDANEMIGTWVQKETGKLVLEVRYVRPTGIATYVCDLYSWDPRALTEKKLLRAITDKFKAGELGDDWFLDGTRFSVSDVITSGKYETPDDKETTN